MFDLALIENDNEFSSRCFVTSAEMHPTCMRKHLLTGHSCFVTLSYLKSDKYEFDTTK